jgi:hypothetical protein
MASGQQWTKISYFADLGEYNIQLYFKGPPAVASSLSSSSQLQQNSNKYTTTEG